MKKKVWFIITLLFACIVAYWSGYYGYQTGHPKTEMIEPFNMQKSLQVPENGEEISAEEYYIAKKEQDMLMIYKMPEAVLYESIEINSLHITEAEEKGLRAGMVFSDLPEVFEFLENSMS